MLLQGLFVPVTCPFYRDGASYLRKLEHNVARYSLSPVNGLVALMPGAETGALTDAEAVASLQAVGETGGKEKVLIAGVERGSVHAALSLIAAAEEAKFDAVLLAPPPDWARLVHGSDARELIVFYEAVADQSPLPIVLWSDARPPYLQLPVELLASMARHRKVIGLVDADLTVSRLEQLRAATAEVQHDVTVTTVFEAVTRRMLQPEPAPVSQGLVTVEALSSGATSTSAPTAVSAVLPALKTRSKRVGFQILSGTSGTGMVPLLAAGAAGAVPVVAACVPQACFEAYAAWKDGDTALAEERAARLSAIEELALQLGPAAVKAGCDFNAYFGGQPRLPRLPLTGEQRAAVEAALLAIRN